MGRYAKYDNDKVLSDKIDEYFEECDSKTKPFVTKEGKIVNVPAPPIYTILGLCIYLDIHRDTLSEYQKLDIFSDTIKRAKTKIQANRQQGMLDGSQNPTGCIFDLKHNHKWKDKTEVKHSGGTDNKNENTHTVKFIDYSKHG